MLIMINVLLVRSGIFEVILFQEHLTGCYPNHISEFFQFNPHIWQSTLDILCRSEARLGQIWHSVSAYRVNNKSLSPFLISLKILTKRNDFFVCYILKNLINLSYPCNFFYFVCFSYCCFKFRSFQYFAPYMTKQFQVEGCKIRLCLVVTNLRQRGIVNTSRKRTRYFGLIQKKNRLNWSAFLVHLSWKFVCFSDCLLPVCPSVNCSHFYLVLKNHWANFQQTWHKASLCKGNSNSIKLQDTNIITK